MHTGRIIFEFLIHEIFEFGEFDDVVVHGSDLRITKAEHSAIEVNILTASELHIEADAEFDERNKIAINDDLTAAGVVDAGENFEKGRFTGAVATDDTDELAFFDVEADVVENLLIAIALDTAETIEDGLLKTPRALGGKAEGLGEVFNRNGDVVLGIVSLDASANNTLAHLDFLRKEARAAPENQRTNDKNCEGKKDGENLAPGAVEAEIGDAGVGDEAPAGVLDDLGDGIEHDDAGGEHAGTCNHGNRIDDGDGVEKGLEEDFPDGADVAIFDIDGAKKQGDAEGEKVEFKEEDWDEQPTPGRSDAINEGENYNNDEIDADIDNGGEGGGDSDDVFGEADFANEIAASDDGLDALIGTFGEEAPEDGTEQEIDGVMWDVIAKTKKPGEDDVEDGEK